MVKVLYPYSYKLWFLSCYFLSYGLVTACASEPSRQAPIASIEELCATLDWAKQKEDIEKLKDSNNSNKLEGQLCIHIQQKTWEQEMMSQRKKNKKQNLCHLALIYLKGQEEKTLIESSDHKPSIEEWQNTVTKRTLNEINDLIDYSFPFFHQCFGVYSEKKNTYTLLPVKQLIDLLNTSYYTDYTELRGRFMIALKAKKKHKSLFAEQLICDIINAKIVIQSNYTTNQNQEKIKAIQYLIKQKVVPHSLTLLRELFEKPPSPQAQSFFADWNKLSNVPQGMLHQLFGDYMEDDPENTTSYIAHLEWYKWFIDLQWKEKHEGIEQANLYQSSLQFGEEENPNVMPAREYRDQMILLLNRKKLRQSWKHTSFIKNTSAFEAIIKQYIYSDKIKEFTISNEVIAEVLRQEKYAKDPLKKELLIDLLAFFNLKNIGLLAALLKESSPSSSWSKFIDFSFLCIEKTGYYKDQEKINLAPLFSLYLFCKQNPYLNQQKLIQSNQLLSPLFDNFLNDITQKKGHKILDLILNKEATTPDWLRTRAKTTEPVGPNTLIEFFLYLLNKWSKDYKATLLNTNAGHNDQKRRIDALLGLLGVEEQTSFVSIAKVKKENRKKIEEWMIPLIQKDKALEKKMLTHLLDLQGLHLIKIMHKNYSTLTTLSDLKKRKKEWLGRLLENDRMTTWLKGIDEKVIQQVLFGNLDHAIFFTRLYAFWAWIYHEKMAEKKERWLGWVLEKLKEKIKKHFNLEATCGLLLFLHLWDKQVTAFLCDSQKKENKKYQDAFIRFISRVSLNSLSSSLYGFQSHDPFSKDNALFSISQVLLWMKEAKLETQVKNVINSLENQYFLSDLIGVLLKKNQLELLYMLGKKEIINMQDIVPRLVFSNTIDKKGLTPHFLSLLSTGGELLHAIISTLKDDNTIQRITKSLVKRVHKERSNARNQLIAWWEEVAKTENKKILEVTIKPLFKGYYRALPSLLESSNKKITDEIYTLFWSSWKEWKAPKDKEKALKLLWYTLKGKHFVNKALNDKEYSNEINAFISGQLSWRHQLFISSNQEAIIKIIAYYHPENNLNNTLASIFWTLAQKEEQFNALTNNEPIKQLLHSLFYFWIEKKGEQAKKKITELLGSNSEPIREHFIEPLLQLQQPEKETYLGVGLSRLLGSKDDRHLTTSLESYIVEYEQESKIINLLFATSISLEDKIVQAENACSDHYLPNNAAALRNARKKVIDVIKELLLNKTYRSILVDLNYPISFIVDLFKDNKETQLKDTVLHYGLDAKNKKDKKNGTQWIQSLVNMFSLELVLDQERKQVEETYDRIISYWKRVSGMSQTFRTGFIIDTLYGKVNRSRKIRDVLGYFMGENYLTSYSFETLFFKQGSSLIPYDAYTFLFVKVCNDLSLQRHYFTKIEQKKAIYPNAIANILTTLFKHVASLQEEEQKKYRSALLRSLIFIYKNNTSSYQKQKRASQSLRLYIESTCIPWLLKALEEDDWERIPFPLQWLSSQAPLQLLGTKEYPLSIIRLTYFPWLQEKFDAILDQDEKALLLLRLYNLFEKEKDLSDHQKNAYQEFFKKTTIHGRSFILWKNVYAWYQGGQCIGQIGISVSFDCFRSKEVQHIGLKLKRMKEENYKQSLLLRFYDLYQQGLSKEKEWEHIFDTTTTDGEPFKETIAFIRWKQNTREDLNQLGKDSSYDSKRCGLESVPAHYISSTLQEAIQKKKATVQKTLLKHFYTSFKEHYALNHWERYVPKKEAWENLFSSQKIEDIEAGKWLKASEWKRYNNTSSIGKEYPLEGFSKTMIEQEVKGHLEGMSVQDKVIEISSLNLAFEISGQDKVTEIISLYDAFKKKEKDLNIEQKNAWEALFKPIQFYKWKKQYPKIEDEGNQSYPIDHVPIEYIQNELFNNIFMVKDTEQQKKILLRLYDKGLEGLSKDKQNLWSEALFKRINIDNKPFLQIVSKEKELEKKKKQKEKAKRSLVIASIGVLLFIGFLGLLLFYKK